MPNHARLPRLLGEFVVIVVGVFLALAGESWYQSRSEARGLEGYLDRLVVDLAEDSASFGFVLELLDRKDLDLGATAAVAAGLVEPDSMLFETLVGTAAFGFRTPTAQRGTYDDLVATGNLRLVDDDEVRSRIAAYYDHIGQQWERIDRRRTGYPHMVYRLDPSYWEAGPLAGAGPRMRQQAVDSLRTLRFMNLLSAERSLSAFQRDVVSDALVSVTELLATVRRLRDSI
jgi:hypothetical protein